MSGGPTKKRLVSSLKALLLEQKFWRFAGAMASARTSFTLGAGSSELTRCRLMDVLHSASHLWFLVIPRHWLRPNRE